MEKLLPNSELFYRIATGDEDAFKEVFYYYNERIYPYFLRKVRSEAVARDMVQDVFFKLWLHREALKSIEHGEGYLFKIGANILRDYFRKLKREIFVEREAFVESEVWVSETRQLLEQGLQLLPLRRRQVYEMRLQGYSYDEIGAELNLSVNTVKNQLVKASKVIREFLISSGLAVMVFILLEEF